MLVSYRLVIVVMLSSITSAKPIVVTPSITTVRQELVLPVISTTADKRISSAIMRLPTGLTVTVLITPVSFLHAQQVTNPLQMENPASPVAQTRSITTVPLELVNLAIPPIADKKDIIAPTRF